MWHYASKIPGTHEDCCGFEPLIPADSGWDSILADWAGRIFILGEDIMSVFRARVPSRIDFLGGGSDAPPFSTEHGGAVLNAGTTRYATCTLEVGNHLTGSEIHSLDIDKVVHADSAEELAIDGQLDLIKSAIKRSGLTGRFRMRTEADLPTQSGLGASASIGVAVLAACRLAQGASLDVREIVGESFAAERIDLGLPGGKQDMCGAAFGGIHMFEFQDPDWTAHSVGLSDAQIAELETRLLLVYSGASHVSDNIHADIKAAYADETSPTKQAMYGLKRIAHEGLDLLRTGRLDDFGALLNENWKYHKDLHPSCTNDRLEEIYATAGRYGIIGGKTCGAGGGGCVVFYCKDGSKRELAAVLETIGCQPMHFTIDRGGLCAWQVA